MLWRVRKLPGGTICKPMVDKSHRETLSHRRAKPSLTAPAKRAEGADGGEGGKAGGGEPDPLSEKRKGGPGERRWPWGEGVRRALPLRWAPCAGQRSRVTTSVRLAEDSDAAARNRQYCRGQLRGEVGGKAMTSCRARGRGLAEGCRGSEGESVHTSLPASGGS